MNKNMPGGKFWWPTAFCLPVCLSICSSHHLSAFLTDVLSLCMLSCLSLHQTVLNNSLQPLRELSITFPVCLCVYVWWDVAFPASSPCHLICLCVTCSLSLSLFTVYVSLLLLLVVNLKSTQRQGWLRVGGMGDGRMLLLKVWKVWHMLLIHPSTSS